VSDWIPRIREAREAGDPNRLLTVVPYARFLGLSAALADGELRCTMRFSDHLVGDSSLPALHGGTTAALLESAAIFTVLWSAETDRLPKTINLTVDYLRSGRARDTVAAATIEKAGRRVVNVRAVAWQDDRAAPIASATAHFLLAPADA
jgi:uncharacterized protein (TIGR00369 family)